MGTWNDCAVCGKELKKKSTLYAVSCEDLDFCHGDDCGCYLYVGGGCARVLRKKGIKVTKVEGDSA